MRGARGWARGRRRPTHPLQLALEASTLLAQPLRSGLAGAPLLRDALLPRLTQLLLALLGACDGLHQGGRASSLLLRPRGPLGKRHLRARGGGGGSGASEGGMSGEESQGGGRDLRQAARKGDTASARALALCWSSSATRAAARSLSSARPRHAATSCCASLRAAWARTRVRVVKRASG